MISIAYAPQRSAKLYESYVHMCISAFRRVTHVALELATRRGARSSALPPQRFYLSLVLPTE